MIKKYEIIETVITYLYPNSELYNLLDNLQTLYKVPAINKSEQQYYSEYQIICDNCKSLIGVISKNVRKIKPYKQVGDKILCKKCYTDKNECIVYEEPLND